MLILVTMIVLLLAGLIVVFVMQTMLAVKKVPAVPVSARPAAGPRISILIPARNEARVIERCLRSALAQDYPDYELIVVDDGSTDGTSDILCRLQQEDSRLQVLAGAPLAPGWKGKQHALSQAYAQATGEWLLFVDADTALQPQLAASLLAYAQCNRIAMLSAPGLLELGSFWERAILPAFASLLAAVFPAEQINDPSSEVALAAGQCIFISRQAYEAIGGHAAVRGEVAEDLALAQRVKQAGLRLFMADGSQLISVRMYHSGREVVEGLAKNAMTGVHVGGLRTLRGVARQTLLALGPLLLLGVALWSHVRRWPQPWRRLISGSAGIALVTSIWNWSWMYRRIFRQPARYGLLYPLGIVAYGFIGLYAALRLRFGKGVTWKGRLYQRN